MRSKETIRKHIAPLARKVVESVEEAFFLPGAPLNFRSILSAPGSFFKARDLSAGHAILAPPEDRYGLLCYSSHGLEQAKTALSSNAAGPLKVVAQRIVEDAEQALHRGPYSVTDKTTLPPSRDLHDYLHPAPYYWPNPGTANGLPYVKRDGQRVPGTIMYEPESDQYDRTRLQFMFDGTTALALGWALTGRDDFARHGAALIKTWFIEPTTRMSPHLLYAQIRRGHNEHRGSPTGIIELKDFYYFLDAVRLVEHAGALRGEESSALRNWLRQYLAWLETSFQGRKELIAKNNHGTYFDLHTAAIAAFLDEWEKLWNIALRARSRIARQFTPTGEQPGEMARSISQHYCTFNLQGWLNLLLLTRSAGLPPVDFSAEPYSRIAAAFGWLMKQDMTNWPYDQAEPFDQERVFPLALAASRLGLATPETLPASFAVDYCAVKSIFNPHDAIQPYWNLHSITDRAS